MDIIEHALKRFNAIVTVQECACDDTYGIPCPVHDDRRFAAWALQLYQERHLTNSSSGAVGACVCWVGGLSNPGGICGNCDGVKPPPA